VHLKNKNCSPHLNSISYNDSGTFYLSFEDEPMIETSMHGKHGFAEISKKI